MPQFTFPKIALCVLLVLGLYDAVALAVWYWPGRTFDGVTSGVWAALAWDFAHGEFYRPLLDDTGYGGTRYMPVFFVIYGTLMWLFQAPTLVGALWMQTTVLLTVSAIAALLIAQRVPTIWAIALALVTYCTTIYLQYLTDVNADYLAAALSLWGLWIFVTRDRTHALLSPMAIFAMVLFVLAFYTKFSTVYAPAAVILSWMIQGRVKPALGFAALGLVLLAIFGAGFYIWSDGRIAASLVTTASGGTDLGFALGAVPRFLKEIFVENPAIGVSFALALWVWLRAGPDRWHDPLAQTFLMVTAVTLGVNSSVGIAGNHVIPLHAVSLAMLGRILTGTRTDRIAATITFAALSAIILATWTPGMPSPRASLERGNKPTIAEILAIDARWKPRDGRLFAVHPMHAIIAGQRPFLLDGFNLSLFIRGQHAAGLDFQRRIESRYFDLLIVVPTGQFRPPDYVASNTGYLERYYRVVDTAGQFRIMLPK